VCPEFTVEMNPFTDEHEYAAVAVTACGSPEELAWQLKLSAAPAPEHVPVQAGPLFDGLSQVAPLHSELVVQEQLAGLPDVFAAP
jgi:hypothetical protein